MTSSNEKQEKKEPVIKKEGKKREVHVRRESQKRKTVNKEIRENSEEKLITKNTEKQAKGRENKLKRHKKEEQSENLIAKKEVNIQERNSKISKRGRRNSKKQNEDVRMKKSPLKIIPLGGLLEIGKNITVFEYEDEIIIVDCRFSISNRRYAWSRLSCRRYNLFRKK